MHGTSFAHAESGAMHDKDDTCVWLQAKKVESHLGKQAYTFAPEPENTAQPKNYQNLNFKTRNPESEYVEL